MWTKSSVGAEETPPRFVRHSRRPTAVANRFAAGDEKSFIFGNLFVCHVVRVDDRLMVGALLVMHTMLDIN